MTRWLRGLPATSDRQIYLSSGALQIVANHILECLEQVLVDTIIPGAGEVDRLGRFPRESIHALGEAGILGMLSDPRVGGGGAGYAIAVQVIEGIARHCASTAVLTATHFAATLVIDRHGPRGIHRAIASGRHLSTLALNDLGASNPV
jgi:alkylation response protein AidB-like acyl-CoA dehydrogenase